MHVARCRKCDANSDCLKVKCDKYKPGYATVRLVCPCSLHNYASSSLALTCCSHLAAGVPSGGGTHMRCCIICTTTHCVVLRWQVSIKGKKCFGKTPITYIAVSYGYGKGAPVCADNK